MKSTHSISGLLGLLLNKKNLLITLSLLTVLSIFVFIMNDPIMKGVEDKPFSSRKAIEYTQKLVIEKKPEPTISALVYAYSATAYYETFKESRDEILAENASKFISEKLLSATSTVDESGRATITLLDRAENDGHLITRLSYPIPQGDWVWIDRDTNPKTPFTPNAGSWKRWIVEGVTFQVPPPPPYKSNEYLYALEQVRLASENRNPEQGAAVNFWGGIPGTAQPAGIWLDQLFSHSKKYDLTNEEYAYVQMVLAQTLSDAFMECWKVKYTYWTKRPDMEVNTIDTAMPNPPFPGYVSGHSTISFAAATVLGAFFPEDKDMYLSQAEEAKNSRLWAGIHFGYDNEEGQKLGVAVGEAAIKNQKINKIR